MNEELIQMILNGDESLNLSNPEHMELVKKSQSLFNSIKSKYEKMYDYYKGKTDALNNYQFITERRNNKINLNYIKKFVKEEVSYSVGKDLAYESNTGNVSEIKDVNYTINHWNSNHNIDLMKYMLIFSEVYELYYIDKEKRLCSKIIKPIEGFGLSNEFGDIVLFMHVYKSKFTDKEFMDIYSKEFIWKLNDKYEIISGPVKHIFGRVPVTHGVLSYEKEDDTIYSDIKGLQDAFETNLSDISNEISDFRNAYLKFLNSQIDEEAVKQMKKLGILQFPNEKGNAEWLIKNINDTFIQNTLNTYEDKMYQLACHINANEKMQSNTSSLALRARLNAMENKCTLNTNAHKDIVKKRVEFICKYLNIYGKEYDSKDINIKYTPNIPQDDLMMAQILSQVPEGTISKETGRSQFSFIPNAIVENERVNKEQSKEEIETGSLSKVFN
ncbi:phage portal protein [Clostridium sp. LY3-2]|uniref:phage portal protein n=1 Tax=Clostridium sp. LY3-2 TaxID=2942482 RepID=UPI002152FF2C|nr:phage portal protein [Clostridium sp. LY3-2]MCR6516315.1 phage portal protein [Clostridium sp. LY3-2]